MKKSNNFVKVLSVAILTLIGLEPLHAQLGVGTSTPDSSAQLDITSTTRGALLPRMSSAQMNAISNPATGLLAYCNDCTPAGLYHYNGSAWVAITDLSYQNSNFTAGLIIDNNTSKNIQGGQLNLRYLSTGTDNLALGYQALDSVTTGSSNVAIGARAGSSNTSGASNVYLGNEAGQKSTTNNNVMIGHQAGFNSTSQSNVYLGYQAGFNDTTIANTQRLYIDNSNTNSPLLGGDFAKNKIGINMHIDSLNRDSRASFQVGGDMQFMNGTNINEFSTDGTMSGNSDNAIPTEKAVKQYADSRGPALETVFNFNPSTQNNVYEQYLGNFFTSSGPIEIKVGDEGNSHFGGAYIRVMRPYNAVPVVTYQERGSGGEYRLAYRIISFTEFELFLVNASFANNSVNHRVEVYCPHAYSYDSSAVAKNNTNIDTAAVRRYVDIRQGLEGSSIGTYSTGATLNVNGTLKLELGKAVKEFSTDSTLTGNSRDAVPTEQTVKYYVDNYGGLIETGNSNVHGDNSNMVNLTTGISNLALGSRALLNLNTGGYNMALGTNALTNNRSGSANVAIGVSSLINNNTGTSNVAIGTNAGSASTGDTNLYIGNFAGQGASGDHQLYIENSHSNTPLIGGNFKYDRVGIDTAISSLNGSGATLTVGGDLVLKEGVAVKEFSVDGYLAGNSDDAVPTEKAVKAYVDSAAGVVFTGSATKNYHTNFDNLTQQTTAHSNIALGERAMQMATSANFNVALGEQALRDATTASSNLAIGWRALGNMSTGIYNVGIGSSTGYNNSSGSNNVYIGNGAGAFASGSNELWIEDGTSNTPLIGGNFAGDRVGINRAVTDLSSGATLQVGGTASKSTSGSWSANSDRRLKTNIVYMDSKAILAQMLQMKGVSYEWNDTATTTPRPEGIQYGFIAQEIEEVWPSKITKDGQGYLMTAYGDYDPMFVESIRALHDRIQELEEENATLKAKADEVDTLKAEVAAIKEMLGIDEVVSK